jgi:hypothetical protein
MSSGQVNISSYYIEKMSLVYNKTKKEIVLVYVEDDIDIRFWRPCFNKHRIKYDIKVKRAFDIESDAEKKANGCSKIASMIKKGHITLGPKLMVCLDSDYKFILNEYNETYSFLQSSQYAFETYAHSRENLISSIAGMKDLIQQSIPTDEWIGDIDMQELYDGIASALFLPITLQLYLKKTNSANKQFDIDFIDYLSSFKEEIMRLTNSDFSSQRLNLHYKSIRDGSAKLFCTHKNSVDRFELIKFRKSILSKIKNKNNCLYFLRGHDLFNQIIKPLAIKISSTLFQIEKEIRLREDDAAGISRLANIRQPMENQLENRTDCHSCTFFEPTLNKIDLAFP